MARPPPAGRVRCWWWWLNGQTTKEAITRDLVAMREKGFGGANLIDAAHGSRGHGSHTKPPHGPDFGSPEWVELFVHALREADRLGLELGLNIQSGWNLGGPTVTPEHAAKRVVWSETTITGGATVATPLPQPRATGGLYVDVAVLAAPLPEGVDPADLARVVHYKQKAYHAYPGGFTAVDASHLLRPDAPRPGEQALRSDGLVDLTDRLREGTLDWDAPPGRWLVMRFGYTLSGARVSTSSDNWDGWAIDYLDQRAFDAYCRDVLSPILDAAGPLVGRSLKHLHTDSWELGPVNWTPALPAEFKARRGYDLTRRLPAVAGYVVDSREASNRFLNDFRRTLGDLIADQNYRPFAEYAAARGLSIHPESGGPHAAPVDALLCLSHSAIPMGEFWARSKTHRVRDFERLFVKQPSSAAHVYGRRLVMAEAFTSIGPHWTEDPRALKPVFDQVACEGLNMVMWHTFDSSPREFGLPGLAYFAGTHLNPNVTWWGYADGFLGYLNRCQFLLQQGLPVADVLHFYGENVPSFVRLKRDDPARVLPGYDYDVANLQVLLDRATAAGGRIVLPDGMSYAALSLPGGAAYGLDALERVAQLAEAGALVVGPRPTGPIGLNASEADDRRFHQLADRLWGEGLVRSVGVRDALAAAGVPVDFEVVSGAPPQGIDTTHRRTDQADVYFVSNRRPEAARVACRFRVAGATCEAWDPVTGAVEPLAAGPAEGGRTVVTLDLAPEGSLFVVFHRGAEVASFKPAEPATPAPTGPLVPRVEIPGPWRVEFPADQGGPGEVDFDTLSDWVDSPLPSVRHFAGTATYRTSFELPRGDAERGGDGRAWIDLGELHSLARVRVNGKDLGVVWTPPFRVEATGALREGVNELQVDVVNVWHNRLVGDAALPPAQRRTSTNIAINPAAPLLPAGMLGPVRVLSRGEAPPAVASSLR